MEGPVLFLVLLATVVGPLVAAGLVVMSVLVGAVCAPAFATRWAVPRRLRRCPLCGADAVCEVEPGTDDDGETEVALCCGQCGAWRRLVTTRRALARHDRALEHDRRVIARAASSPWGDAAGEAGHQGRSTTPNDRKGST